MWRTCSCQETYGFPLVRAWNLQKKRPLQEKRQRHKQLRSGNHRRMNKFDSLDIISLLIWSNCLELHIDFI